MSSFKRRAPSASTSSSLPGCRPSLYTGLPLTSTGVPSLDDLLGGGVPLESSLLVVEDADAGYAKLLLKYWIAQGLAVGQDVVVVGSSLDAGGDPKEIVKKLMGTGGNDARQAAEKGKAKATHAVESDEEGMQGRKQGGNMKIAWRYEGLGKHDEGVEEARPSSHTSSTEYCTPFDLTQTCNLDPEVQSRIHLVDAAEDHDLTSLHRRIKEVVRRRSANGALRIAIQSLGSPGFPESSEADLFSFVSSLRALVRGGEGGGKASAMVTYPAALRSPGALRKLQWATDGCMTLESFAGNIASQLAFPNHQGMITFPRLPSLPSLVPPSTKSSILRGGLESNLGFRVGRRRGFRIELMGLGIEGGVTERRTKPPPVEPTALPPAAPKPPDTFRPGHAGEDEAEVKLEAKPRKGGLKKAVPRVRFGGGEDAVHEHTVKQLGNTDW